MYVKTSGIKKIYDNGLTPFEALGGVSIGIEKGTVCALVGASGSGKTTLLNIIGAIDTATAGEVIIDDESLSDKNSKALSIFRRKNLGFIFQSYNLIPVLTAYENVALALFESEGKDKHDKVMSMLDKVGLIDKAKNYPNQLSGGQQQRVSVARALVKTPKLLLADEPTANLDSKTGKQILDLLLKLNNDEKITILFSTHDSRVMDITDKIYTLSDGKIIEES